MLNPIPVVKRYYPEEDEHKHIVICAELAIICILLIIFAEKTNLIPQLIASISMGSIIAVCIPIIVHFKNNLERRKKHELILAGLHWIFLHSRNIDRKINNKKQFWSFDIMVDDYAVLRSELKQVYNMTNAFGSIIDRDYYLTVTHFIGIAIDVFDNIDFSTLSTLGKYYKKSGWGLFYDIVKTTFGFCYKKYKPTKYDKNAFVSLKYRTEIIEDQKSKS